MHYVWHVQEKPIHIVQSMDQIGSASHDHRFILSISNFEICFRGQQTQGIGVKIHGYLINKLHKIQDGHQFSIVI